MDSRLRRALHSSRGEPFVRFRRDRDGYNQIASGSVRLARQAAFRFPARGDLHYIALLIFDTGLRMGEVLSLEWSDVRRETAEGIMS